MCSICGKKIHLTLYPNKTYRGGHFFGRIPLYHKKELQKAEKFGTRAVTIQGFTMDVLKVEPKPYAEKEYWECPGCYWSY